MAEKTKGSGHVQGSSAKETTYSSGPARCANLDSTAVIPESVDPVPAAVAGDESGELPHQNSRRQSGKGRQTNNKKSRIKNQKSKR